MWEWLERMRRKPKFVRDKLAFLAAVAVTGVIALTWSTTLPGHFAGINVEEGPEKEAMGAFARFFSIAKSNLSAAIQSGSTDEGEENDAATSTPPAPQKSGVVIPDLSEQNIQEIKENKGPTPRPVLIGTTSNAAPPAN